MTLRTSTSAGLVALLAAYVVTAKLGIALPVGEGLVTPVWAPTGIATVALVIAGLRWWPAIYAAALLANVVSGAAIPLAFGIAIGNTAQAVIAALVLRHFGFRPALDRIRDVVLLIGAAVASSLASATNGATWLLVFDHVSTRAYAERWLLWWSGDAMGVLVVGAAIFAVMAALRAGRRPTLAGAIEFAVALGLLVAVSSLVFSGGPWRFPALILPFWIWLVIRFRAIGATTATLAISVIGIASTIAGNEVIDAVSPTRSLQIFQALLAFAGLCVLAVAATLTERDQALETEREATRQLRALDEMKDHLLAAVSHELRTPLTSILALATMLQERDETLDPAKRQEMYRYLSAESHRLDTLLTDLLDLERLRLGLLEPRYERVDLAAIVRTVATRHEAPGRIARLDLEDVQIEADESKVERILDNLVGNACKHTPLDGGVAISVRASDGGAVIHVDDRGDGVPDELKLAIFEPFHRGSGALAQVPGTGIGLSLVAHFTELHGGRAWVEDRDGGGSSFRVFLPATRPAD